MSSYRLASLHWSWVGLILLAPLLAAGCQDRVHSFVGTGAVRTDDAGATGTGGTVGGTGGRLGGTGGQAGMIGGTGGTGVCVPAKETCADLGIDNNCNGDPNDVDPTEVSDVSNCGTCFNQCIQAYVMDAQCLKDTVTQVIGCKIACVTGYKDLDGDVKNGCECQITSAAEVCNLKDDNCDGQIDEGFNLMADPTNCGRCGVQCAYPFAQASCNVGTCEMGACLAGFFDANKKDSDGCECQKTNGGMEICDGVDNNCDGQIDEVASLVGMPPCKTQGVCAGTVAQCHGVDGWSCTYSAAYQEIEDMTLGCDGKDNDCDGKVDEAFDIGKACQVGTGPCAGTGVWVCNGTGRVCNGQMKQPQAETCNGLDDDCDGKVDELSSKADMTADDKLVYITGKNVTMFAYEATRYDATGTNPGFDSTHRPCSVAGKRPWASITKEEAAAACALIGTGWRLCAADEWLDACNGMANTTFPYGATYAPTKCVGYDYTSPAPTAPVATGAATMCVSDQSATAGDELYDMSGNVKEWALTTAAGTNYEIRGGAYDIESFNVNGTVSAPGLQCDSTTPAPSVAVRLPSVGFRCCLPGMLPAQ